MTTVLRVATRALSLVRPCQAQHDIRHYINCIHCEPNPAGGVIAVATDGHRMAAALDPNGQCAAPINIQLPADAWRQCDRAGGVSPAWKGTRNAGSRDLVVSVDPGKAPTDDFGDIITGPMLRGYEIEIQFARAPHTRHWIAPVARDVIVDGKFPEWRRVLPKTVDEWNQLGPCQASLNPHYLSTVAKHVSKDSGSSVRLWQRQRTEGNPANDVVLVQFGSTPGLVVVIAPRTDGETDTWPMPGFMRAP